jgi:hypothetical protein
MVADIPTRQIFLLYLQNFPEAIGLADRVGRTPFLTAARYGNDGIIEVCYAMLRCVCWMVSADRS